MKIVVCYGALRSGTTLLRLMLNQHTSLHCPGEADFLVDHLTFGQGGEAVVDTEALSRNRFYTSLGLNVPPSQGREAVIEMMTSMNPDPSQTLVLMLHRGMHDFHKLFPDVPVVHFLRDPRDVARSSIGMGWAGNVYYGSTHWIRTEKEWDRAEQELGLKADLDFYYENLIREPKKTLSRFLDVVGLKWEEKMLDYDKGSTYEKPSEALVEQWRHKQSETELALVEGRVGDLLTRRGYAPSGSPPRHPSWKEARALKWQSKWYVWKSRFKRFGLLDPILEMLGRNIGIKAIHKPAKARIDEKILRDAK